MKNTETKANTRVLSYSAVVSIHLCFVHETEMNCFRTCFVNEIKVRKPKWEELECGCLVNIFERVGMDSIDVYFRLC